MDLRIAFFGCCLLLVSCGGNTTETTVATELTEEINTSPQSLYILHCEACHGMDGKKGTSGAADLSVSKLDDAGIKQVILNGNTKGMMPYKDIITSDKDVNTLVEYVKTLRK